jgi:outer membrane protein
MKRAAQFLVVALIIGCFASNTLAQDKEHMFDGFWKTERGSIVKIDGDEGIFVHTPVESWKSYIDKLIIRNIHKKDDKWIADEYISPNGKGFWAEIEWELNENRIIRRVLLQGHTVESYYEKVGVVSQNPGIHLDNPGQSDNPGIRLPANPPKSNAGRFGIGARAAYVDYSNDDYVVYGVKVDTEPDDSGMYGVNLTYFFDRYASFELSVDYTEADVELSALGLSGDAGALEQVPVLLTLRMHFSTNPRVSPYIGGGVGWYFNSFDTNRPVAEFIYGPGADIDVDDTYGFHVNAGIEVFLNNNLAINFDIKHIWSDVEAEVNVPGFTDEEFDLNALVAGVGLKYYF